MGNQITLHTTLLRQPQYNNSPCRTNFSTSALNSRSKFSSSSPVTESIPMEEAPHVGFFGFPRGGDGRSVISFTTMVWFGLILWVFVCYVVEVVILCHVFFFVLYCNSSVYGRFPLEGFMVHPMILTVVVG